MLPQSQITQMPSKHQNPREGIKTQIPRYMGGEVHPFLQNTKIPVRGLKPVAEDQTTEASMIASKHQNPREGIKTDTTGQRVVGWLRSSKHQNPREGIKTNERTFMLAKHQLDLQNTKIPVRGLKLINAMRIEKSIICLQNTKIPVRGLKPLGMV